ncbi:MAG: hypothetical protein LBD47_10910 [Treponema sp.]|nr:hypothetical protein [Treponema sp.]
MIQVLREAIEKTIYALVGLPGDCGEVTSAHVLIDGTMLEAQANRHTAVWRKNVDRYESGQRG